MRPVAFLLPFLMLASTALAEEPMPRTISVNGTAIIYVVPDEADLRFSINTFRAELPEAKSDNDKAAGAVLAFLKQTGIEEKDIQAGMVNSRAIYEYRNDPTGRQIRGPITGYEVTRQYAVKLRDLTKLGPIYDQLLPDSRVNLEGHTLGTSQSRKYRDQARTDAAKAAIEKANLLAAPFGARVGSARVISEVTPSVFHPQMRFANAVGFDAAAQPGGDLAPVGQIEVRSEVNVTFDLVPGAAAEQR